MEKMKKHYFFLLGLLIMGLLILTTASTCSKQATDAGKKGKTKKATYTEAHRPQFHFSPPTNWASEPSGLVHYDGEYHLFYEHNPTGMTEGNLHWRHAVSTDLVHWEDLGIAIEPDTLGQILPGSVVMDVNNTSKLGTAENPPMVAMYTYEDVEAKKGGANNFQTQGIAYSLDKGRTWEKYQYNPVLVNPGIRNFRNPKMFWHAKTFKWVMVISESDHVKIFASPNLTYWVPMTDYGKYEKKTGFWQSPDLIEVPVEGIKDSTEWVALRSVSDGAPNGGSGIQYTLGLFQGKFYYCDQMEILWMDHGRDNYCGTTFSGMASQDLPKDDGRNLYMGWMNNQHYAKNAPTEPWKGAMTLPRELSLRDMGGTLRLVSQPAKELKALRLQARILEEQTINTNGTPLEIKNPNQGEYILEMDLSNCTATGFGLAFSNAKNDLLKVGYDFSSNRFFVNRKEAGPNNFEPTFASKIHWAPRFSNDRKLKLHVFVDASSVELFADDGATVMTETFYTNEPLNNVKLFANGGTVQLKKGEVYELESAVKPLVH